MTEEGQARLRHLENIFDAGDSGVAGDAPTVGRQARDGHAGVFFTVM